MPKYHIWTIGCQMNKAESERLASLLEASGYTAASEDKADLVLLNSCVVRQGAEDRVINKLHMLRKLKISRPDLSVALTGCLVNSHSGTLKRTFPHIDHLFPAGELPDWLKAEGRPVVPESPEVCTYVPIIQGCDNFCAYCIVPYRRGRERSRPLDEIVCEVEKLVAKGVKEVTLLGQNVDSYGHDLPGKPDLADLLVELNKIEGLERIRFLTNHPKDMNDKLIEAMANLEKVCEQVNLPVQAGNNAVLKAMRRGYTVEHYRELVRKLREKVPDIALGTDVIVGFPGESAAQFQETYDLLAELKFDTVHIAAYSTRPGTIAAREYKDDVPATEKKRRQEALEKLQESISSEINARLPGKTVEVIVDDKVKGKWRGRTRSDKLVFFSGRGNYPGKLVRVKIEKTSPWSLQGSLVKEEK